MSNTEVLRIVEEKLPIKYILGIEREFEAFPDAFDIVYIYINRAMKQPDRWGDAFTKHSIIKYEAVDSSIETIEAGLKRAIELGLIECTNETEGKESYRIILNPFA